MKHKRWEPEEISLKRKTIKQETYNMILDAMAKDIYEYMCQASVKTKTKRPTESKHKLDKAGKQ